MRVLWSIIGAYVAVIIYMGLRNMLAFSPSLFLFVLLLFSFFVSMALWHFRKRLRSKP